MQVIRGLDMKIWADVASLKEKLKANRDEHIKMYSEAVDGFKDAARRALEGALRHCNGKQNLFLNMPAPQNCTSVYDTVIGMLEMNTEEKIELSATEYRQLVEDKWDWTDSWLLQNARYSETAGTKQRQYSNDDSDAAGCSFAGPGSQ